MKAAIVLCRLLTLEIVCSDEGHESGNVCQRRLGLAFPLCVDGTNADHIKAEDRSS